MKCLFCDCKTSTQFGGICDICKYYRYTIPRRKKLAKNWEILYKNVISA